MHVDVASLQNNRQHQPVAQHGNDCYIISNASAVFMKTDFIFIMSLCKCETFLKQTMKKTAFLLETLFKRASNFSQGTKQVLCCKYHPQSEIWCNNNAK